MLPSNPALARITNRTFLSAPLQHALVVAILFLFSGNRLQGRDWLLVHSPYGDIYTDAGEAVARRTISQFHSMANAFQHLPGSGGKRGLPPLRVMIFAVEKDFAEYRPSDFSNGFYQSGPEGDWIVFRSVVDRVALHEYTHLLLNRSVTRLPQWLEEGIAEFFSTLRIDKGQIVLGSTIPQHLANLRLLGMLPAPELSASSRNSIHYRDPVQGARFYATSWALVHMLYLKPEFAARLPRFAEVLDAASMTQERAFEEAFGMTIETAVGRAEAYINQALLPVIRIGMPEDAPQLTLDPARKVEPEEIARIQAELLLDSGHRDKAAEKYRKMGNANLAARAFFAMSSRENTKAMALFEQAIAQQPDARTVFEYAMLLRDSGAAPRARVTELLHETLRLNPRHPEARMLLGVRATDEKRYAEAVEHLREAVAILPRQSSFWHALGFAQSQLGNIAEARKSALKAVRIAETPEEEKMARDLLLGLDHKAANTPRTKGDAPMPDGWKNRQGDATAVGTLQRFVCDQPARLELKVGNLTETFVILDPQKLVLRNLASTQVEFACGSLEPRTVKIEYLRATRDITAIDFTP